MLCACTGCWRVAAAQNRSADEAEREQLHATEQWRDIQKHLPDPATATPAALELEADVLVARRFPEDALDFYRYAMARGGNAVALLDKLGLVELEMHNTELARGYFKRAVKLGPKDSTAWNDLGALEYMDHGVGAAIADYKHAIKLDKKEAVYHANLSTAYFEAKDFDGGRREMATALKLDPHIFDNKASGGVQAHVLSGDRGRFAYEMAKWYAHNGQIDHMLHSLTMACEAGMEIQQEMRHDPELRKFENDPRVVVMARNAQLLRAGKTVPANTPAAGSGPDASQGLTPVAQ